jgi:E3 ubiquitin-protein ligase SHPRH
VRSSDDNSVLVEAECFKPAQWFLKTGKTHFDVARDPPRKRRKIESNGDSLEKHSPSEAKDPNPLLFKATIDLQFDDTASHIAASSFGEHEAIQVHLVAVRSIGPCTAMTFALYHVSDSPLLTVEVAGVSNDFLEFLRSPDYLAFTPDVWVPETIREQSSTLLHCTLTPGGDASNRTIRFDASLYWRSGMVPILNQFFMEPTRKKQHSSDYRKLVAAFPSIDESAGKRDEPWSPLDFYASLPATQKNKELEFPSTNMLESYLFSFQKRAVTWLLRREGREFRAGIICPLSEAEKQHEEVRLVDEVVDLIGRPSFVNTLTASLSSERPEKFSYHVSGGLLAEEMGLGKTVEIIALISLNRRINFDETVSQNSEQPHEPRPSQATLIICPNSILQQWISEFEKHAPSLRVLHYQGVPKNNYKEETVQLLNDITTGYDVVLTTYKTLGKEIYFATDPPDRSRRRARQYVRKKSPLVQVQWWRVCLDEAQMLESGVTNAAQVACLLPRVHSWAVSGTPLRKDVQDICGLLIFLDFQSFHDVSHLSRHVAVNRPHVFGKIFSKIGLRHTKALVRDEMTLPPQKRVVITMPFSVFEQQNYSELFDIMCKDIGLRTDGSPVAEDWDPNDSATVESMRSWLARLRQTCLHPQVGNKNRRALGRSAGPLRTVAEVLEVMIEQSQLSLRQEERNGISASLTTAHILGNNKADSERSMKALEIYDSCVLKCKEIVADAREKLVNANNVQSDEDPDSEGASQLTSLKNHLRVARQLLHTCLFFLATAHYQVKTDEGLTTPKSGRFNELERKEVELYEEAKIVRRLILEDATRKSEALMKEIRKKEWVSLPELKHVEEMGGIETQTVVDKADEVLNLMREQSEVITKWRAKMVEFLLKPLVDKDDDTEMNGEEYEESTKQQDELYAYFDAFKAIQADLGTTVTGQAAPLIDHEVKTTVRAIKNYLDPKHPEALKQNVHAPELALELYGVRNKLRARKDQVTSLRDVMQRARTLEGTLSATTHTARGNMEREMVQSLLKTLQNTFQAYGKTLTALDKESVLFHDAQNQRIEFYRQLQEISDEVAPYKNELDEALDEDALHDAIDQEQKSANTLAQLRTKNRFLLHLRDESNVEVSQRICVICQSPFELGVLTVCGHQYCKDCIQHWFHQSRTCPICKRRLAKVDVHDIVFKPQDLKAQEETSNEETSNTETSSSPAKTEAQPSSLAKASSIYANADDKLMDEIKSVDLPVSYGTKIDTLGRHLLHIRNTDAGVKSVVFSQYREFLDVLSTAFTQFKIGHTRLGNPRAVETFKNDPSVDCLLLDAKTDSSGLTLTVATHVFICEPLVHTSVELQAIARVHRIGQTRPTTVWMYLVSDTVEESIYELSVARRLAHVRSHAAAVKAAEEKALSDPTTDDPIVSNEIIMDVANDAELQKAPRAKLLAAGKGGGELVGRDDLWQCLFGNVSGSAAKGNAGLTTSSLFRDEINRHLRAEAAEGRRRTGSA